MRTLMLAVVLLAVSSVAAQAESRNECIGKYKDFIFDKGQTTVARFCDPKNFVSTPNEYGWVCHDGLLKRVKGEGAKQQRDALCGTE